MELAGLKVACTGSGAGQKARYAADIAGLVEKACDTKVRAGDIIGE